MNETLTNEQRLLLAGLLHDIGKFYQRADAPLFKGEQKNPECGVKDTSFNLAQEMCPPNKTGRFGYHHVVWTSQFFENDRIRQKLNEIPGMTESVFSGKDQSDNVINLACRHHEPKSDLQDFVRLADWWSAGIDRTVDTTFEKEEGEAAKIKFGRDFHKRRPLRSVFDLISTPDEKPNPEASEHVFPLKPLNIAQADAIFPFAVESETNLLSQDLYNNLWKQFEEEFEKLPKGSFECFFESLLNLLRKYCWCIPSNTKDMAHVSLYDHLRLTAAFAQSLYRHFQENGQDWQKSESTNRWSPMQDVFPVLLVGGDISGIQDFIYNISSRRAALSLKGRSFYLQMLIDTILLKIIEHERIKASHAHVVYASGGKFYMVLPNTEAVCNALAEIRRMAEKELWAKHHGKVAFLLEWIPFKYDTSSGASKVMFKTDDNASAAAIDEKSSGLAELWQALSEKLQKAKTRVFLEVVKDDPASLFDEEHEALQYDPDGEVCAVTGVLIKKGKARKLDKDEEDEFESYVEKSVYEQIELGKALKKADFIITANTEQTQLAGLKLPFIELLGYRHYIISEEVFASITSADNSRITRLNNTDFLVGKKGSSISYGFRFYGGNEQAGFSGANAPERAKTANELTRYKQYVKDSESYLGILRMDVDGLGDVFVNRIPDGMRTFSFYATLSSLLDVFFSGYLNTIRNSSEFRDHVNILYSGGDDLFIFGRWDKVLELSATIRQKFALFVRRNDLSISGGLVMVHGKFPIRKAADMADEAEKKAKGFNNKQKNAVTVFDVPLSWSEEFGYVQRWKNQFLHVLSQPGTPKNILHRIMAYSNRKRRLDDFKARYPGEKPDFSYKWQAAYAIKRLESKYHNQQSVRELLAQLRLDLFAGRGRNYDLLGIAARWAELELRFN
ncbi:MAG: type III-A CRISPR-associated protein Cas10/Csm1 [Bacteroidetes bacterium]|nr:type III-A CRISPR-associated protein Cas10/Csm1 [Bacteroidota bacterium]